MAIPQISPILPCMNRIFRIRAKRIFVIGIHNLPVLRKQSQSRTAWINLTFPSTKQKAMHTSKSTRKGHILIVFYVDFIHKMRLILYN